MEQDGGNWNENFDNSRTETLSVSSRNSKSRSTGRKRNSRKKSFDIESFKVSILRTKRVLLSKMKLGKSTLDDMDDFIFHILEDIDKELHALHEKELGRKVSIRDLETVVKLCFPKDLGTPIAEFAKTAVGSYFNQALEEDCLI